MAEEGRAGTSLVPISSGDPAGGLERIGQAARELRRRYLAIPSARRSRLIAAALLVSAICAAVTWYAGRTDWRILFSGLDAKDTQQIAQELAAAGIQYQMTADGSGIEVGADQLARARMEVATKGMPQSGRMGFELFDTPNWVGSEFDEKVNYQRALEGELEHTIGTLSAVRSARVHLALPKESLFSQNSQVAKASVVLQLRRPVMPPEQAEAIRSLLAGAIENLSAENVALIDADGRLNLSVPDHGAAGAVVEQSLQEKLITMLEPTAGGGNVRATVNISYDESTEEKTDEVYDPSQVATLSLHKSEQTTGLPRNASGIPGTESNTPGPTARGSTQAAAGPALAPPLMQTSSAAALSSEASASKDARLPVYPQSASQSSGERLTEETGSYAVTRHLLHSEQGPGRVRRVTAAVLVNDRQTIEGSGKAAHTVWKQRSPDEMQRLEQLARAAIGFESARGDQVVIENVSFSSNAPLATAPAMERVIDTAGTLIRQEPGLWKMVSLSILTVLLVMAVLRPITTRLMIAIDQAPLALAAGTSSQHAAAPGDHSVRSLGQSGENGGFGSRLGDVQAVYKQITEQIRKEPVQSTRLLESWISAPVEEE